MSPNPLTPAFSAAKNDLASEDALAFLYEIEVPTSPPTRLRLTTHDDELDWLGHTYSRAPMMHSEIIEDTEGNLPTVQLTVPNVSREITAVMSAYAGLVGQPVRVTLVSLGDMSSGQPVSLADFTIATGQVNRDAATFRLQIYNPHRAALPGGRISRTACWYKFRGPRCGFAIDEATTGAITCDHTYDGANGCAAKGALYEAEGLTAIHPKRFGGFRSVPRQSQGGGGL